MFIENIKHDTPAIIAWQFNRLHAIVKSLSNLTSVTSVLDTTKSLHDSLLAIYMSTSAISIPDFSHQLNQNHGLMIIVIDSTSKPTS